MRLERQREAESCRVSKAMSRTLDFSSRAMERQGRALGRVRGDCSCVGNLKYFRNFVITIINQHCNRLSTELGGAFSRVNSVGC